MLVAYIDKAVPSMPDALDRGAKARSAFPLLPPDDPELTRLLHKVAMRRRAPRRGIPHHPLRAGPDAGRSPVELVYGQVLELLYTEDFFLSFDKVFLGKFSLPPPLNR